MLDHLSYLQFLNIVIDEGIEAARRDYAQSPEKLRGAIDGFELCRNLPLEELPMLYEAVVQDTQRSLGDTPTTYKEYWYWRCREAEVSWVCNVLSALILRFNKEPLGPAWPTARAVIRAASILGRFAWQEE